MQLRIDTGKSAAFSKSAYFVSGQEQ